MYEKAIIIEKYGLTTSYFWALFYFFFNTGHLIFALKYWSLSIKLKQVLQAKPADVHLDLKILIFFISFEIIIIGASSMLVVESYEFWVLQNFILQKPVALVG